MSLNQAEQTKILSVLGASLGTIVEWYDFMLFAYLTPIFSAVFFPHKSETASLFLTFGIYAAGFLMAPLGSLFFGSIGDRFGRKSALFSAVVLMSLATFITIFLPSYREAGLLGPLSLMVVRLVQGFSIGGQYGTAMVTMIENAKHRQRGLIASIATMTSGIGVFLASLTVTLITLYLTHQQVFTWGWRIPYVIGALFCFIALIMRFCMRETSTFEKLRQSGDISKMPIRALLKNELKHLCLASGISAYGNIAYYFLASYLVVYITSVLHVSQSIPLIIITVFGLYFAFSAPLWGMLSDKVGRKPLLLYSALLTLIIAYPCFYLLKLQDAWAIATSIFVLSIPLMAIWGAYGAAAPELFSTKYRNSGTSISYNIGNSFFGGLTPLFATTLISLFSSNIAPIALLIIPSILIIPMIKIMPETAFDDQNFIH